MMKKAIPKKTILFLAAVFFVVGGITAPCMATTDRLLPESGYAAHDYTMDSATGMGYSGGLDVVYTQQASGTAAAKTRAFLKTEDGGYDPTSFGGIQVNMYSYMGDLLANVATVYPSGYDGGIYCTGVKLNPDGDQIWFSMTGSDSSWNSVGHWYTVDCDSDLTTFSNVQQVYQMDGNWEAEWSPIAAHSGYTFLAGALTVDYSNPVHSIVARKDSDGSIVEIYQSTGYSCGFAFDDDGNLWTGTYTSSGPADQQYIVMFAAASVSAYLGSSPPSSPLDPTDSNDYAVRLNMPTATNPDTGTVYYTGTNDIECDPDGNLYVTANGGYDPVIDAEAGFVLFITNNGTSTTDSDMVKYATTDPTSSWDWLKSLSYDGESTLDDSGHHDPTQGVTGNRLYVDLDFSWGSGGPDQVAGLTTDDNSDGDGVPDALDNAYLTDNEDQVDADLDMYGNMVDGDFNNDNDVNFQDYNELSSYWGSSSADPQVDMNSDGAVNFQDYNLFSNQWGSSGPYY